MLSAMYPPEPERVLAPITDVDLRKMQEDLMHVHRALGAAYGGAGRLDERLAALNGTTYALQNEDQWDIARVLSA